MDVSSVTPLTITNLVKKYGEFTAVGDVSLTVKPGEILGLLGPNGAGKTSLISCIVTLQQPTAGEIRVFGYDPQSAPNQAKLLLGFVPQELINHGYFSVYEIMEFHSGYFQRWSNQERIDFLLNKVGLFEHRHKKARQLSGGMKRRLLIAKALVHEPPLLLLDEPTAGVDIELRNSLWDFVQELRQAGTSILLTTHYLEEAEILCDRVGIIHHGKLLTVGPTKELIGELTQRKVIIYFTGEPPPISSPYLAASHQDHIHFLVPQNVGLGELLHLLAGQIDRIKDIVVEEGSLEEAFVRVVGGAK